MAKAAVFLAVIVGLCAAFGAWAAGEVGLWGALGLYIGAGWAAILALLIVTPAGGVASRHERLASDPARMDEAVMVAKRDRMHR